MNESFYYGQGKVYLAERDSGGRPLAQRWVGDVSKMELALTVENATHKESYSGQRATVRRITTGKDAKITSTWHDFSPQNMALQLYGDSAVIPAGTVTGEKLPADIKAGERYTLEHQNVSEVVIGTLVHGTDFVTDPVWGAIEFLKPQATAPSVNYRYAGGVNTTLFTRQPRELFLRYEGVNLAEGGAAVVVELYKVLFDPTSALSLITSDQNMAGMETTAGILFDGTRPDNALLGRFGRIINVAERSD